MSMNIPTLVIICGLPGSGKTTLSRQLAQEMPAIRFSPDEWMEDLGISLWDGKFRDQIEQRFWHLAQDVLKLGQSVILENGFWGRSERDAILDRARELDVRIELRYLDVPIDELKRRLEKRQMEGDKIIITKIEEYSVKFQRPNADELKLYDNYPSK